MKERPIIASATSSPAQRRNQPTMKIRPSGEHQFLDSVTRQAPARRARPRNEPYPTAFAKNRQFHAVAHFERRRPRSGARGEAFKQPISVRKDEPLDLRRIDRKRRSHPHAPVVHLQRERPARGSPQDITHLGTSEQDAARLFVGASPSPFHGDFQRDSSHV